MKLAITKRFIAIFIIAAFSVSFSIAQAAEHGGTDLSSKEHGGKEHGGVEHAGEKLAEGIGETATGWTEVPKEISETTEEGNIVEGVTVGTVKGAAGAVVKTTEGVVKAATFFVPDDEE